MGLEDKKFLNALNQKFKGEDQESDHTSFYCFDGWKQSERKREFNDAAEKLAKERNMPFYNPDIGVPLGQRQLMAYKISGTEDYVEGDDLHFCNNAAIQQLVDDIKRTIIVGMDTAHSVLQ